MSRTAKPEADTAAPLPWATTRQMLLAEDMPSCRQAIAEALDNIMSAHGYAMQIAELVFQLSQDANVVWCAGDASLGSLEPGPALRRWLQHARQSPAQFLKFDSRTTALLIGTGEAEIPLYLLLRMEGEHLPEKHLTNILSDFTISASRLLYRLCRDTELRLVRDRVRASAEYFLPLLRANADLVWEAGPDAVLHVTHVFNGRTDLVRHIDKCPLNELPLSADQPLPQLLSTQISLRNLRLTGSDAAGNALYMSIMQKPSNTGFCGTLSAGPDLSSDLLAINTQIVETMLGARLRESQARRETEGMLLGLRILLAQAPFHEKIRNLAQQLAVMTDCDTVHVIHHRTGSKPRLLGNEPYKPGPLSHAVTGISTDRVQLLRADCEVMAFLQNAFHLRPQDSGVVTLPCGVERYLFLLQGRHEFGSRELGMMDRFSLLLEQALLLRADQDQMVHAAKLSALGQMSTGIAHELRQPLNTISIAAQNLALAAENGDPAPGIVQEKVERILQQVDRACTVMDRMRRFGRKSAGDYSPCALAELAYSARALMLSVLEKNGIEIAVDIPEDAIALVSDLEVEQVLVNLLQNACDAVSEQRPHAPPLVRIWTGSDDDPAMVRMHVQDNGPGFPPDVLKHALDAFFSTKPADQGTGIGLSISHTIMREHGGRMEVGNADGGGGLITLIFRRPASDASSKVIPLLRRSAAASL